MDILSKLVNDKVNSTKLAYTIDEAEEISDKGFTPIFSVSEFLEKEDPFMGCNFRFNCSLCCTLFKCKAFNSNKCKWYIYPRT